MVCLLIVIMLFWWISLAKLQKGIKNTLGEAKKVGAEGKSLKVVSELSKKNP